MMTQRAGSLVVLLLLWASGVASAQPTYTVTELYPFFARGVASPYLVGDEQGLPVRLDLRTGAKLLLEDLGFGGSAAAVLPSGLAVGSVMQSSGLTAAALWAPDGALTLLPGTPPSRVTDLRDSTRLVGLSTCAGQSWITRWHLDSGDVECVALAPTNPSGNLNVSVGIGLDGNGRVWTSVQGRVIIYEMDGTALDLGPGFFGAVNADGVAAISRGDLSVSGTTVWRGSLADGFTELPNPIFDASTGQPWTFCGARDINADGTIVGSCGASQNFATAGLWLPDGRSFDLRAIAPFPSGSHEVFATDIDDAGRILAPTWRPFVTGSTVRPAVLITPVPALAEGECGGPVRCECGDTVVADYTFTDHLGCEVHGTEAALVIRSGVTVDNQGQYILWGTGDGTGILFDNTANSRVRLHSVGFAVGVKMRAGAVLNAYYDAVTHSNSQYGILITEGANSNIISSVSSVWNSIAGIAVDGVGWNSIQHNNAWSNPVSLDLRNTQANIVWSTGLWGDYGFALAMTNAHANNFAWDYFNQGQILLINSSDNQFPGPGTTNLCPVVQQSTVASR